ncbi:GGDEF domain-containing protein [Huintestinicola sp.]
MEKNDWLDKVPEALKRPFKAMYELIYKQDEKIKDLENRLKATEKELEAAQSRINDVGEVAKNAVVRAEKAESKLEEIENNTDVANKFIASIVESQGFDQTMAQIESTTKQLINCEKATFYRLDEGTNKFYNSDGNYRDWTAYQDANELRNALISGEASIGETKALIPIVSENNKPIGVIVAENSDGFDPEKIKGIDKGSQFANNVSLAIQKDINHQQSITDPLTGLKNRNGNDEFVKSTVVKKLNNKEPVSIIMTDIDHFKQFNDTFGHDAGDEVIKSVANVLENETRKGTDCAFRFGGEELVVICGGNGVQAMEIAERIRKEVEATVHHFEKNGSVSEEHCTVSVGVSQMNPDIPVHTENAIELYKKDFKRADDAIYVAKASGRNQVVAANPAHKIEYLAHKAAKLVEESGDKSYENTKQLIENSIKTRDMSEITNLVRSAASNDSSLFNASEEILGEIESFVNPEPHMILALTDNDMTKYFHTTAMDAKEIMDKVAMGANILDFMSMKEMDEVTKSEFDIIDKLDSKMKLDVNKDENLFKFEAGRKAIDVYIRDSEMPLSEARRLTRNNPDCKSLLNDFIRVKLKLRGINDNIFSNTIGAIKDIKKQLIKGPIISKLDKIPQWADKMKAAIGTADKMIGKEEQAKNQEKKNDMQTRE